jgi:hypothetical protein
MPANMSKLLSLGLSKQLLMASTLNVHNRKIKSRRKTLLNLEMEDILSDNKFYERGSPRTLKGGDSKV